MPGSKEGAPGRHSLGLEGQLHLEGRLGTNVVCPLRQHHLPKWPAKITSLSSPVSASGHKLTSAIHNHMLHFGFHQWAAAAPGFASFDSS